MRVGLSPPLAWKSPLGKPSRNVAIAFPSMALLLLEPVDEVNSLPNTKQPLGHDVASRSPPIRR
jgi:hypothetical protein